MLLLHLGKLLLQVLMEAIVDAPPPRIMQMCAAAIELFG
jgi:hypothetical protein